MTSECKKTPADPKNNNSSTPQAKQKRLEERIKKSENMLLLQSRSDENKDDEKPKTVPLRNSSQTRSKEREEETKLPVPPVQNDVKKKRNRRRKERSTSTQDSNKAESCMTDIIIEKARMLKNQELQIEALSQQVSSLKEVCKITKDMLDIRNIEVKQLNDKLSFMEDKFKSEKDRHEMVHSKLETMMMLNAELKNEYRKQLSAFSELKKIYHDHLENCNKSGSDSAAVIKDVGDDETKLEITHTNIEIENTNEISEVSTTENKQEQEGQNNKQEIVNLKTEPKGATQSKGDAMLDNVLKTKYEFVTTSSKKQNKEGARNMKKAKN